MTYRETDNTSKPLIRWQAAWSNELALLCNRRRNTRLALLRGMAATAAVGFAVWLAVMVWLHFTTQQ